jgi:hypothetical protein
MKDEERDQRKKKQAIFFEQTIQVVGQRERQHKESIRQATYKKKNMRNKGKVIC